MPPTMATAWIFGIVMAASAGNQPLPNSLTPQEAADGWLLLFDGNTSFGWKFDGEAKVEPGELILGTKRATRAETTTAFPANNAELRYEYRIEQKVNLKLLFGNHVDSYHVHRVGRTAGTEWDKGGSTLQTSKGAVIQASTLRVTVGAGERAHIRSLKLHLRSQNDDFVPLFNGKDLTGWKVYPGKKSKFTVTSEGWLNVKDGPGDLQTEGRWSDFVLQLECKSNGKHLNSGIFFRAQPGEYQQGYEAQIRNQFTAEPTQEYTIEDHDPATHELKSKRKAKYTAVDYGTGAIYRRMPARQQMSRDGEWFTMTVIAQGRHLATWVNGVQVVDWTDNRPLKDNARKGCCLNKGAISIQGHDPTTDLSFRNIRLAALPPAK